MIIYLVILPDDQQFIARKDFHLIQNRFYDKKAAIDFLNHNKHKYPTAKIIIAELRPEASQHTQIFRDRVTFPANSISSIDENPDLAQTHLDMRELARRTILNAGHSLDEDRSINRAAHIPAQNDREALLRTAFDRLMAQPGVNRANPILPAAHPPSPHEYKEAILSRGLFARLDAEYPNRDIPAAASSPSPVHADREPNIRVVAQRARPTELPNSLPDLKVFLSRYLQIYIVNHPNKERRREIAEEAQLAIKSMDNNINTEAFKMFLMIIKKEIEKTPDHKASGLWRIFEEIIKKVDLLSLAATPFNQNLVTQRFPFINDSHIEKARQLDLVDPVSGSIMENPVRVLPSGKYYDKSTIDNLKASGAPFNCPLTRQPVTKVEDAPEKKKEIEAFLQSARGNQFQPEALVPPRAPSPNGNKPR